MTKLIQFHGHLKDLYPEGIRIEAGSAYEAIAALQNFKHFRPEEDEIVSVILPDFQSRDALHDLTDKEVIHVHPFLAGAGGKTATYLQIIVGVVLIATGWGAGAGGTVLGMSQGALYLTGAMMVLGGVSNLLMPQPKLDTGNSEENRSNYLSATKNTVKIGTRIPLIFGKRKWYGHFLSFNVTATAKGAPDPTTIVPEMEMFQSPPQYVGSGSDFTIYEGGV